jgi:predicted aspartyl protease
MTSATDLFRACGIAIMLMMSAGCETRPMYGPVSDGVKATLKKNTRPPRELGVVTVGDRIFFQSHLAAPDETRVRFDADSWIPRVQCRLNGGQPVGMMLDTGSQRTVLDGAVAAEHQVKVLDFDTTEFMLAGVVGKEKAMVGLLSPLTIASASISQYPCLIRTHQNAVHIGPFWREKIDLNLLGFDLPLRLCSYLTVDYPRGEIVFGFKKVFQPTSKNRVTEPLIISNALPHVRLRVKNVEWLALIDTGSSFGVEVDQRLAAKLGIDKGAREIRSGLINAAIGGTVDPKSVGVRLAEVDALQGLGPLHRDAEVAISPGTPRVGSYFLKDYRVTFDLRRNLLWLER